MEDFFGFSIFVFKVNKQTKKTKKKPKKNKKKGGQKIPEKMERSTNVFISFECSYNKWTFARVEEGEEVE